MIRSIAWILIWGVVFSFQSTRAGQEQCSEIFFLESAYEKYHQILNYSHEEKSNLTSAEKNRVTKSFGTEMPILRSFEKEGLYYEEIEKWFSKLTPKAFEKMNTRYEKEIQAAKPGALLKWIASVELLDQSPPHIRSHWRMMSVELRWKYLSQNKTLFMEISSENKAALFENEILDFNDLSPNLRTPRHVIVGDDDGSYEVRLDRAIPNRSEFLKTRQMVEEYLEGRVGHQHLFHSWPKDAQLRSRMAPQYIELLDATTWYLFWRQMTRNPDYVDSVLAHPYLGVYSSNSLQRLYQVVLDGRTDSFNDKFRMVGARAFKPIEKNQTEYSIDWELRSGNKGQKRGFVEAITESRLVTGDYADLQDFRSYKFDTRADLHTLLGKYLDEEQLKDMEHFQKYHPSMSYSLDRNAANSGRTRILSPFFEWENRLPVAHKAVQLERARKSYAQGLAKVAHDFRRGLRKKLNNVELGELRSDSIEEIETLIYQFAQKIRFDLDLQNYLQPKPVTLPKILITSSGRLDVNQVDLGIEYSFRFPLETRPENVYQASQLLKKFSSQYAEKFSSEARQIEGKNNHGHGLSIQLFVQDSQEQTWRVEWDGIARRYSEGKVEEAWGGHMEVVTPKFNPQTLKGPIVMLYETARKSGMIPSRAAGGGHVNFDIQFLKDKLSPEKGTRALLNLVSYFENNRDAILFLWMHPKRKHAAFPVTITPEMVKAFNEFQGDWSELGKMLYEQRYFNVYVGRKPKYMPINLTALMTDHVPAVYRERVLDIKNPEEPWFPNFNNVRGRGEARFFDAPTDEFMAGLQIKYFRALMNKAFNSSQKIALKLSTESDSQEMVQTWKQDPAQWYAVAAKHLQELGLNVNEFLPLIWDSYNNQISNTEKKVQYQIFRDFLPPENK